MRARIGDDNLSTVAVNGKVFEFRKINAGWDAILFLREGYGVFFARRAASTSCWSTEPEVAHKVVPATREATKLERVLLFMLKFPFTEVL